MPAIQSAAEAPLATEGAPLISWTAFVSSPAGSRSSAGPQPRSQRCRPAGWRPILGAQAGPAEAAGPRSGACRSRLKIRERSPAITAAFREALARSPGPTGRASRPLAAGSKARSSGTGTEVLGFKGTSGFNELFTNAERHEFSFCSILSSPRRQDCETKNELVGRRHPTATQLGKISKTSRSSEALEE